MLLESRLSVRLPILWNGINHKLWRQKLYNPIDIIFHSIFQAYGPHPLLRAASPYQPVASNNSVNTGLPQSSFQPQQPQQTLPLGYPSAPLPPSQPTIPQGSPFGGYTLPPTAANFPVSAYTNAAQMDKVTQEMMSQDSLNQLQNQQPNTPDLLMHRRQVREKTSF